MSSIIKSSIAFGSIVSAGGVGYGIYSLIKESPKSYEQILKGTLLETSGNTNQTQWTARLVALQELTNETNLVNDLKLLKAKNSDNTWTKLRDWCKNNIKKQANWIMIKNSEIYKITALFLLKKK